MTDDWQDDPEVQAAALEGFLSNPAAVSYAKQRAIDDELENVLGQVWAAALDAKHMIEHEGATEDDYLRKQRHHFDRAKAKIRALLSGERKY